MRAKLAVCEVAVSKRAAMEHDRELGRRDDQPLDAADRTSRSAGGDEHGRVAATMLEDVASVNAGGRPGWLQTLGAEDRVELSQRTLPPGEQVLSIDRRMDRDRCGRRHGSMLHGARRYRPLQQPA